MPDVAAYKLTDLLSSAGATIGVIIAGTIFLQFLSTKYTELSKQYREITGEYRRLTGDHCRHGPVRTQIQVLHRRLVLLNRASWLGAVALLCLLSAVLAGGVSMLFPDWRTVLALGTAGLLAGLTLIGAAVAMELYETILAGAEIGEEVADLDEDART